MKRIPPEVKTPALDLVMGVSEINSRIGDEMWIMIAERPHDIDIMGANCINDIAFYAHHFKAFGSGLPEQMAIFKVKIEDPENLPYEISGQDFVYVIYNDCELRQFESMEEASAAIEEIFKMYAEAEIDMFAVMVGHELSGKVTEMFLSKMEKLKRGQSIWSMKAST
jgi:hypothetical protein